MSKLTHLIPREKFVQPNNSFETNGSQTELISNNNNSDDTLNEINIVKKYQDFIPRRDKKS